MLLLFLFCPLRATAQWVSRFLFHGSATDSNLGSIGFTKQVRFCQVTHYVKKWYATERLSLFFRKSCNWIKQKFTFTPLCHDWPTYAPCSSLFVSHYYSSLFFLFFFLLSLTFFITYYYFIVVVIYYYYLLYCCCWRFIFIFKKKKGRRKYHYLYKLNIQRHGCNVKHISISILKHANHC